MKHSVSETHLLAALAFRAEGRIEVTPEELDVAVERLIQRDQLLFVETVDAAGAIVYDPLQISRIVLRVMPITEARDRMREQAEAVRAYALRQHELRHQRDAAAAATTGRPS